MNTDSTVTLRTGRKMPVMGLGTWQLTRDTAATVAQALEYGYRLIDTSSDYGTQPGIGEARKRTNIPRDHLYIVTKVEETDEAYSAAQQYVQEMGLEYADLILIHRPPQTGVGEDLWRGLIKAKEAGIATDIGVSNYSIDQIEELISATGEVPAVNQIEWSPFGHSQEMLAYCQEKKIVIQAYSPLTRTKRLDDPTLNEIAARHQKSPAQVLIRWNLQLGTVPIPKANQLSHLQENLQVFDFELSQDEMTTLNGLNEHYSSLSNTLIYL